MEYRHVVLTLRISCVFDMLLRGVAHFPDMVGAAAPDDVVAAQRPCGGLEADGAKAPQRRPRR